MAKPTKRPTKHKIDTGTSDKVARTGAPRPAVKKISRDSDDIVDEMTDELDDDVTVDDADDTDDATTDTDTATSKSGSTGPRKTGVKKVDVKGGDKKPASKHTSKRVTAKGTPAASARYTPPAVRFEEMPSPIWVPILMFSLFLLGMLSIFLNYVGLLPGATSNWYLLLGLGFILAGIITATQYR